ncbi:MAG TPA: PA14 domain-containing protein, partial [Pirellulales bacterium]|nr:PA14 domain-containing protein [Pirellulales bacterium]
MLAAPALAADDDDDDELPDYRPGLVATYSAADEKPIVRRDNDVQFVWRGASPDPRIAPGPFKARWQGRLFTMSPGKYQLHVYVQGKVRLRIANQHVFDQTLETPRWIASEPLTLEYGYHPLELDFEKTGPEARIGLYWSGPQFQLEPLTERNLVHEPGHAPDESFERGRLLARALRCDACHGAATSRLTAPDLTRLAGNLSPGWIVDLLMSAPHKPSAPDADEPIDRLTRRMPYLGMPEDDAQAIAAFLLASSAKPPVNETAAKAPPAKKKNETQKPKAKGKKFPPPRTEPSAAEGQNLADTVGCLACHRIAERGSTGFFGGTDLSHVASKRPSDFFARWLTDPAAINPAHRMPVFPLSALERQDLALYLGTLKGEDFASLHGPLKSSSELIERGRQLVGQWRCSACHQLPTGAATAAAKLKPLGIASRWSEGCLNGDRWPTHRPGYSSLFKTQRQAVERYYSQLPADDPASPIDGQFVLAERNCLGCHARGLGPGIAGQSTRLTAARPDLAPLLPALAPPSLSGVGDKLHDEALQAAILLKHPPLRAWLKIRMPKFPLADDEMHAIVQSLIDHDRVPPLPEPPPSNPTDPATVLAGSRLVTSDGFGCTSCHKVGSSEPVQVALAAHGTDLSMVGTRIRRAWFDRWVRNPARIVPRMEMPAIQLAVRGVMHDSLPNQLSAVWTALNTEGFEPPLPNPVRIVRTRNMPDKPEPAVVLTDEIEVGKTVFLRPIVIGLPNRQNILFDLETNRLAAWWIGDTARQRTRGKSWYWEAGGQSLLPPTASGSELRLGRGGKMFEPEIVGQIAADFTGMSHERNSMRVSYRLQFRPDDGPVVALNVESVWGIPPGADASGSPGVAFSRSLRVTGDLADASVWYPLPGGQVDAAGGTIRANPSAGGAITVSAHSRLDADGGVHPRRGSAAAMFVADYRVTLPADQFPVDPVPFPPDTPARLKVVPGYEAVRLPLARDEMPTGLAWRPDGTLVISSLKGRVCLVRDTDGDGLEDEIKPFSDDLAAPYGVNCAGNDIDVINKYGLLRLYDSDGDGHAENTEVLADGWGYTSDYHDWAVGLPRDAQGNYYVALPCQQDERSEAAARLRGWALKLVPRSPTP